MIINQSINGSGFSQWSWYSRKTSQCPPWTRCRDLWSFHFACCGSRLLLSDVLCSHAWLSAFTGWTGMNEWRRLNVLDYILNQPVYWWLPPLVDELLVETVECARLHSDFASWLNCSVCSVAQNVLGILCVLCVAVFVQCVTECVLWLFALWQRLCIVCCGVCSGTPNVLGIIVCIVCCSVCTVSQKVCIVCCSGFSVAQTVYCLLRCLLLGRKCARDRYVFCLLQCLLCGT